MFQADVVQYTLHTRIPTSLLPTIFLTLTQTRKRQTRKTQIERQKLERDKLERHKLENHELARRKGPKANMGHNVAKKHKLESKLSLSWA